MELPDLSENPALWLGLRQTEALRESLNLALNGKPLPLQRVGESAVERIRRWLATQGVPAYDDIPDAPLLIHTLAEGFRAGCGIHPEMLVRGSNSPLTEWIDLGAERSGAGWKNPANFLITSAFVRLLGAAEQFELDVLKSLFYYRPSGPLGHKEDWIEQKVEPEVIREKPQIDEKDPNKQVYNKPPLWTWLKKHAENTIERSKIFANIFGISTIPEAYKAKFKQDLYEKRNAIAHGRAGVDMTLGEYIEVDVFVAKSMLHISDQCKVKLSLIV